ncbi:MAG: hypothetical protein Q9223_001127 [Gallowayella weberi]
MYTFLAALVVPTAYPSPVTSDPVSAPQLKDDDDPRFSIDITMSDTKLSPTAVYMNTVELAAQYAQMDYHSRVPQRRGVVLPQYPQIEITVIPAPPARSVEIRLILFALYGTIIDMVYTPNGFNESEVEVIWDNQVKAYIYFTPPVDQSSAGNDQILDHALRLPANAPTLQEMNDTTVLSPNTPFDWKPVYKPDGSILRIADVFLLSLAAIKSLARYPGTERITDPFHIGSEVVDANIQVYVQDRRMPRPTPPFLRYMHVIETLRRVPGWQLERRRFAEFFCSIEVSRRSVGVLLMNKGPFVQPSEESNWNVSTT